MTPIFRSPQAYSDLQSSGALVLPSKRLLQYYKSSADKASGMHPYKLNGEEKEANSEKVTVLHEYFISNKTIRACGLLTFS